MGLVVNGILLANVVVAVGANVVVSELLGMSLLRERCPQLQLFAVASVSASTTVGLTSLLVMDPVGDCVPNCGILCGSDLPGFWGPN